MWSSFLAEVPGKWVLAGEHAVLAGATAIALPHPEFSLRLTFQPQVWDGLSILPPRAEAVVSSILAAVEQEWAGRSFIAPRGTLQIESTIPVGAGLGSSAALCVALTRWLAGPIGIAESHCFEFARQLENRFHGKSSGMDVAVAIAGRPVAYSMSGGTQVLDLKRLPRFTFHDTGLRARTSECVAAVDAFRAANPEAGRAADAKMAAAAAEARAALVDYDRGETAALAPLARAMTLAQECFETWGLMPASARALAEQLKADGALATKITGAGGGGFVVALWS